MARKICPVCTEEFEFIHYGRTGGKGLGRRKYCSYKCQKKFNRRKSYNRAYHRERHLKRTYGITNQQYLEMFQKQKGCCAICKRRQQELDVVLNVDHCHITGDIRGLLCVACNNLLGRAEDNITTLSNAIIYLEIHRAT